MPIRDNEKFCKHFLADTEAEAEELLKEFDYNLELLSNKFARLTGIDREDLKSEGIIGLARAKREFDETRSSNFTIFALYKIKDAMREFISTQSIDVRVPQYIVDASRLGTVLKSLLEKALGPVEGSFTDVWVMSAKYKENNELATDIQATREKISNLADRSHTSVLDLLDRADVMPSTEAYVIHRNMNTLSSDYDQEAEVSYKNLVDDLRDCLGKKRFIQIFDLHFIEGYTVREVADKLGVADGTIAVQIKQLKNKLRHRHTYLNDIEARSRECPPVIDTNIRSAELSEIDSSNEPYDHETGLMDIVSTRSSMSKLKEFLTKEEFSLLYAKFAEGKTMRELANERGIASGTVAVKVQKITKKILKHKDIILGHESNTNTKKVEQR